MDRIPASERTRERLKSLMEGHGEKADLRSELMRLAARQIVEEGLEGEAADALGREYYARGAAAGTEEFDALAGKLRVIYPNIILPEYENEPRTRQTPIKLVFVGSHFGRKGGAVAARAAELARQRRMPLHFHIISSLQAGGKIWSDSRDRTFFDQYFKLLQNDNVTFDKSLPNEMVIEALRGLFDPDDAERYVRVLRHRISRRRHTGHRHTPRSIAGVYRTRLQWIDRAA